MKKIGFIGIFAPHYRQEIFQLLDKELNCDFIVGDKSGNIKEMDLSLLSSVKKVRNKELCGKGYYYQTETLNLSKNYDIIIADSGIICISEWLMLLLSFFRKQKIYLWSHGWYGRESFVKKLLKRFQLFLADGMLLYGNYARDLMIKEGFNPQKLHVIHNSLAYREHISIRKTLHSTEIYREHFKNHNPVLLFIGRITKVKRLDMLIDALKQLKDKGQNFNLVFIGDGDLKEELSLYAESLNVSENIWFYGACYDESKNAELIYNADLCVSPGNVGLTAIHSLTFGTPVLTHDNYKNQMPEFESIKEGITGTFFKMGNVESLVDKIFTWFSENYSKRERIRENCYNEIDTSWTPEYQLSIIKKVINE